MLLPLSLSLSLYAQQGTKDNVARECVLFEVFTGVNCPYCPAAANGIAQMMAEGLAIAPVAYHTSAFSTAEFYTPETNARANYYSISGYPTLKADGVRSTSGGGGSSESMYSTYLAHYNARINVTSPFTIDLSYEPLEGNQCRVNCTVNKVGECAGTDVRVFIVLTQCNIDRNWQGMTGLHHVVRDMIPTQTGTPFTGTSVTINETFEMNYPKEDCYLTAWVQNFTGTKEVYQAVRMSTALDLDYDLAMKDVDQVVTDNCSGMAAPVVSIKNVGKLAISTFDIVAYADNAEAHRYTWNGTLPSNETINVTMPEFSFGSCSTLKLEVVSPDGHDDGFMADNSKSVTLGEAVSLDGYVKLQLKTDSKPQETTFELKDMNSGVVIRTISFEQANHVYTEEFYLDHASCYRFTVKDSAGDGMGNGFFALFDSSNTIFFRGGSTIAPFTGEIACEVNSEAYAGVEDQNHVDFDVYPNPSQGLFSLTMPEGTWNVSVFDMSGRMVCDLANYKGEQIDLSQAEKGVYFIKADNGSEVIVKKAVIL